MLGSLHDDFFRYFCYINSPDIILVSETWLNASVWDSTIEITEDKLFHHDWTLSHGGGI